MRKKIANSDKEAEEENETLADLVSSCRLGQGNVGESGCRGYLFTLLCELLERRQGAVGPSSCP